jgi:hypothetical protein
MELLQAALENGALVFFLGLKIILVLLEVEVHLVPLDIVIGDGVLSEHLGFKPDEKTLIDEGN